VRDIHGRLAQINKIARAKVLINYAIAIIGIPVRDWPKSPQAAGASCRAHHHEDFPGARPAHHVREVQALAPVKVHHRQAVQLGRHQGGLVGSGTLRRIIPIAGLILPDTDIASAVRGHTNIRPQPETHAGSRWSLGPAQKRQAYRQNKGKPKNLVYKWLKQEDITFKGHEGWMVQIQCPQELQPPAMIGTPRATALLNSRPVLLADSTCSW